MTLTGPNSPLTLLDSLLHPGGGNAIARYLAPPNTGNLDLGSEYSQSLDGPKPASFIFGKQLTSSSRETKPITPLKGNEMLLFLPETSLSIHDECLGRYGSVCKFKGMMGEDLLWIADPRAINEIILKGYDCFHSSEGFWTDLAFGPNLVTATGHKHKIQRKVLNQYSRHHICVILEGVITAMIGAGGSNTGTIDVEKWMSNVGLEMIGQAGVGHSFGIMSDKEPEYLGASRQVLTIPKSDEVLDKLGFIGSALIFAGHETTMGDWLGLYICLRSTQTFKNQLRAEVREAHGLHGKDLDYDQINSLKYLDAICRESLRLSPIQLLERVATKDSILPLQNPIKLKDGKNTTEKLHVPRGPACERGERIGGF
ncbi:cytochrome P450 [Rhizoctonia solani]|uniref:Cytochrome P450 n=1 Tax=Rhizoctonia solani TaxID=456999 RepID=A0A8H7I8H9_9AGAM|nr:cytochrome P450 [Rhizoctonia solani]